MYFRVTSFPLGAIAIAVALSLIAPWDCLAVDTSLLFVGEDLSVLTIASRHAETPKQAPAIAQVITREELEKNGIRTLGEALSILPGFYLSPREWGTQPYLRGLPDSILFLYDSVPLTSDSTKSIHPLDEELSLAAIKRIEVIRGPGSVLWGPDAFAGIVNIVPERGRDVEGIRLSARAGTPNREKSLSLNWGRATGIWEGFLSLTATSIRPLENRYNVVRFSSSASSTPLPPQKRLGLSHVDDSKYLEAIFNLSWQDRLRLSGRWSNSERNYVLGETSSDLKWSGKRKAPFRFVRIETQRPMGHYNLRLNAYYNELNYREKQVDISWRQKSHLSYAELLLDRELWDAKGIFTLGASYRYDRITGAVISRTYLPDFLEPDNIFFTPTVNQEDYNTYLTSYFGQIKRHWRSVDAWLGLRLDDHSQYSQTISHNLGLSWHPGRTWFLKLLYGTAFRTPYNQQLINAKDLDPEQIENFSAQFSWRRSKALGFSVTAFWNKIFHHINEDPYGGLSRPGAEDIYGLELEGSWQVKPWLHLWANGSLYSQYGDKERYKVLNFIDISTMEEHYSSWKIPFDTGPRNLFNAGADWNISDRLNLSLRLNYSGTRTYYYKKGTVHYCAPALWLVDLTATAKNVMYDGLNLRLALKNLFDRKYSVPGTYSPIKGAPFQAYIKIDFKF